MSRSPEAPIAVPDTALLLAALETLTRRVAALEDRDAVVAAIAAYGPLVDTPDEGAVAQLWAQDGCYEVHGMPPFVGREAVGALVHEPVHRSYLATGCAHVMGLPHVTVEGDRAVAVNYSRVFLREESGWRIERVSVNRWELARTGEGWQVARRVAHLVDGSDEARALLRGH